MSSVSGGSTISAKIFGPPLNIMQFVILIPSVEGDKIFQRGPNTSDKSGPGVYF